MSREINVSQKENIHRRMQWIERFLQKQEEKLSSRNLQLLYDYNGYMIIHSIADNTRYKNLAHFGKLTQMIQKDWIDVTEKDLRELVPQIMIKHGENGKETRIGELLGLEIKEPVPKLQNRVQAAPSGVFCSDKISQFTARIRPARQQSPGMQGPEPSHEKLYL